MKVSDLGNLASVTTGAVLNVSSGAVVPLVRGAAAAYDLVPDAAFAGTCKIQGSDDGGSTWVDLATTGAQTAGNSRGVKASGRLYEQTRLNCTVRSAGTCSGYVTVKG